MTRNDPLPTYDDGADIQQHPSSSLNNLQQPHVLSSPSPPLRSQSSPFSSSSTTSTSPSSFAGNSLLSNNSNSTNRPLFLNLTNAISARASSIVSTLTFPSGSQQSSYSDRGSESAVPYLPLLPYPSSSFSSSSLKVALSPLTAAAGNDNPTRGAESRQRNCCKPSTRMLPRHIIRLRWIWFLVLLAGEHGAFWIMVNRCSWPESSSWDTTEESLNSRYRMMIIADPQLTDWISYGQSGLLLALVETYTDIYMKRSFRRLHASLRPDAVLFLGDLNDGGRISNQKTFEKNTNRFFEWVFATKASAWNQNPIVMDGAEGETAAEEGEAATEATHKIYSLKKRQALTDEEEAVNVDITGHYFQRIKAPLDATERKKIRDSGRSLRLYVAGNHDVGFGDTLIRSSMKRYKRVFGSANYEVNVGNHSLVVLDTLALSSKVPSIREESQQFLDQIRQEQLSQPRILFTHVPLHRLNSTDCGKARETEKTIKDSKGTQYQNMVNITLSREILESIQPDMVFSGDDHDWCEIAHPTIGGSFIPEVTLRTISFAQGIQRPSILMLSLLNPDHKPRNVLPIVPLDVGLPVSEEFVQGTVMRPSRDTTFVYDECMLPWQMLIYICYGALFAVSLSWILFRQSHWMSIYRKRDAAPSILGHWRRSQSIDITRTTYSNTTNESSIGSSSNTAYQQLDDSTFEEQNPYHDEPDEPVLLGAINSQKKQSRKRSTLLMGLFWKRVARDLWHVIRYVVPFYIFLFVYSTI